MKKINKVIAPLLGISMILMNGAAVFGKSTEHTAHEDRRVRVCVKHEQLQNDDFYGLIF